MVGVGRPAARQPLPQPVERRRGRIAGCGDRDRRGASRDQAYAVRQRIEHDTHRDTLRQPDPGKGRIDVGEQVRAGAALAILDAAGDTLDMAGQIGGLADQADGRPVIDADARQLVLDPPDVWQQLLISHGARLSRSAVLRLR